MNIWNLTLLLMIEANSFIITQQKVFPLIMLFIYIEIITNRYLKIFKSCIKIRWTQNFKIFRLTTLNFIFQNKLIYFIGVTILNPIHERLIKKELCLINIKLNY